MRAQWPQSTGQLNLHKNCIRQYGLSIYIIYSTCIYSTFYSFTMRMILLTMVLIFRHIKLACRLHWSANWGRRGKLLYFPTESQVCVTLRYHKPTYLHACSRVSSLLFVFISRNPIQRSSYHSRICVHFVLFTLHSNSCKQWIFKFDVMVGDSTICVLYFR